jgi:prepilin-type N-terminal cleavage/methylation domain-containing protein
MWAKHKNQLGFTIVELLIVIVVIAILAAISIVAYSGIQERSRDSKVKSDMSSLIKAVIAARQNTSKTMYQVTSYSYTANPCVSKAHGTDLAALPKTDNCWVWYLTTLDKISQDSYMDVSGIVDPWGRPYFIDANEGEDSANCNKDALGVYTLPTTGNGRISKWNHTIPLSGYSGCSI